MKTGIAILAAGLALAPLAALAQPGPGVTYRCVGKDNKKYYGQAMPPQCIGQPVELLNAQGMVTKRMDAQATAAERARKEADEEELKKRATLSKEQGRRDRALLATYTSEKDVDNARARALKENEAAVKDIERRIGGLKQRHVELTKELEFYQGKNKPPAKLGQDIKTAEFDLHTQEGLMAVKKREVDSINAKYDEDKKRYIELTKGK